MTLDKIELSAVIAASAEDVFAAWMSAKAHAAFIGAPAAIAARAVDGSATVR